MALFNRHQEPRAGTRGPAPEQVHDNPGPGHEQDHDHDHERGHDQRDERSQDSGLMRDPGDSSPRAYGAAIDPERERVRSRAAVDMAHERFGGFDVPASLSGMLAALGLTVLLAGIAGAVGSVGYERGVDGSDLSIAGLAVGLGVLVLSFFVGGLVAGRMARYDGIRNGLLAAGWFVVLALVVSALGAWAGDRYDFFEEVRLPQWFDAGNMTLEAVITSAVAIVAMFAAAALGGRAGARYHKQADEAIVDLREDALGSTTTAEERSGRSKHRTRQRV